MLFYKTKPSKQCQEATTVTIREDLDSRVKLCCDYYSTLPDQKDFRIESEFKTEVVVLAQWLRGDKITNQINYLSAAAFIR